MARARLPGTVTLDPVHFDGLVRLAERIRPGVDPDEHRDFAETVWSSFLEPLRSDGVRVIEPLGERRRRTVDIHDVALQADPFPTRHGLDAGTINPTTFRNGLVIDVAQAAMSAEPSDLELHRTRTGVMSVHANDVTARVDRDGWIPFDDSFSQLRVLEVPRVDRFEQQVVHVLALYLAESQHALTQIEAVSDLLMLDGPLYPTGLLEWQGLDSRLERLLEDETPRDVVSNYIELIERVLGRDVALLGFVKGPSARTITGAVRSAEGNAPWVDDTAFFRQVLDGAPSDTLAFTNWFVSRGGADRVFSAAGDAIGLDRTLEPEAYEVTFFMLYDPRDEQIFRIEAPRAITADPDLRDRLTKQVLQGVAIGGGPPPVVEKADELARISREEKGALGRALEEALDSDRERTYDESRWGLEFA